MVAGEKVVVPSGGVGPLTAQAIQISYSELPSFTAIYHSPSSFWKIGFCDREWIRRLESDAPADTDPEAVEFLDQGNY